MSTEIIRGELWSDKPLGAKQLATINAHFQKLLNADVSFETYVDESLLGGFVARIDGKTYDASLLNRLGQVNGSPRGTGSEYEDEISSLDLSVAIEDLKQTVNDFEPRDSVYASGTVVSSSDGVVFIEGLKGRHYGELLEFENNEYGMAMELSEERIGAVLFSGAENVNEGSPVSGSGQVVCVPVGDELLGRVIDPIGRPLDGRNLNTTEVAPVERAAPSIIDRQAVNQPLETGLLSIDSMIPIGRGQRELIIGDRQTGKTQIAIDAILNQANTDVICVYCAIGQKASTVAQIIDTLTKEDAMHYSVIVAATASASPALQYIAPYAACSIAEYFMDKGKDVLIIYDDLSKHAVAYRTMALLLQRPPGREAYPGDVFYLHSRLLERSARLNEEKGGGSMTALPIVETQAGDISAYIPTNIISITDGQIFLETELFNAGIRPAVNVGLSVSRVGRAAQNKAMRKLSGTLRIELAQYRELAVFAQFSSDIDESTKIRLQRGERLTQLLRQDKQKPLKLGQQVVSLLAFQNNAFDQVDVKDLNKVQNEMLEYARVYLSDILDQINATGDMTDEQEAELKKGIKSFFAEKVIGSPHTEEEIELSVEGH